MFVYYYMHVSRSFEVVEPELLRMVPGLRGWAEEAYRDGESLHARIGPGTGRVAKTVEMTVGEPIRGASETWIPVEWVATGTADLFPRLQADIVVAAVGPALTQVALRGTYTVPLGALGRAIDRVLLHRLAEASVKGFVDRLGAAIDIHQTLTSTGRPPSGNRLDR